MKVIKKKQVDLLYLDQLVTTYYSPYGFSSQKYCQFAKHSSPPSSLHLITCETALPAGHSCYTIFQGFSSSSACADDVDDITNPNTNNPLKSAEPINL